MAYPRLYDITYSYAGFQQSQGDNSFPGTQLDADLAGLQDSIGAVAGFVKGITRSNGSLANGIVTYDSLSPGLQTAGLMPATAWAAATSYAGGASVVQNSALYRALVAHTSGLFATDLAAGKWLFIGTLPVLSKAEQTDAEAGTDDVLYMTPLKTKQSFTANFAAAKAAQADAEAGTDDAKYMTALKTRQVVEILFQLPTRAGTLAFWNTAGAAPLASTPAYHGSNPGSAALYSLIPDPPVGYSGFYNGLQISQGAAFSASQQYLGGAVPVRQGIVGTSVIPANDSTTWQAAGVAGYAHAAVAGTGRNVVGLYGQGSTSVANGNVFGGNTLAVNNDGSTSTVGFDVNYITAFEFNINLWKKSGGADPVVTGGHVYGITIAASGNITGQIAGSAAIVANALCVANSVPWNYGFQTYDGAATVGVQLGTNGAGNNVNGQPLRSTGRDAGGTARTVDIHGDPNGALILAPDSASTVVAHLSGIGGATVFQTGNVFGNAKINVPALSTAGVLTNDASGNFQSMPALSVALGGTGTNKGLRLIGGGNSGATSMAAAQTRYVGVATLDAAESNVYLPLPFGCTIKNLTVFAQGSPGVGEAYTATLMKTGVATALTCQITAGLNTASDTTHSATFVQGDRYSLKVVSSAGAASTNISWSVEIDPT